MTRGKHIQPNIQMFNRWEYKDIDEFSKWGSEHSKSAMHVAKLINYFWADTGKTERRVSPYTVLCRARRNGCTFRAVSADDMNKVIVIKKGRKKRTKYAKFNKAEMKIVDRLITLGHDNNYSAETVAGMINDEHLRRKVDARYTQNRATFLHKPLLVKTDLYEYVEGMEYGN